MIRTGSLCSGYEGIGLGLDMVMEHQLAFTADIDPGASKVLAHRFPDVPNLGDLTAIDWARIEPVNVVTAGFSCQDVSQAGGHDGLRANNRSGVWYQCLRAIDALRPSLVFIENVRGLRSARADCDVEFCPWCMGDKRSKYPLRALGAVLAGLAEIGFDAEWTGLSAASVGAPHQRERVFILAWPADAGGTRLEGLQEVPGTSARWPATATWGHGPERGDQAPEDADSAAGGERGQPAPGQAAGGRPRADAGGRGRVPAEWGPYGPAIEWWEACLRRDAPAPVEPSPKGGVRLSPPFVEFMMGLPEGWVTGVPGLTYPNQLKVLGNGCVPQQCKLALRKLLPAYHASREVCAPSRMVV